MQEMKNKKYIKNSENKRKEKRKDKNGMEKRKISCTRIDKNFYLFSTSFLSINTLYINFTFIANSLHIFTFSCKTGNCLNKKGNRRKI